MSAAPAVAVPVPAAGLAHRRGIPTAPATVVLVAVVVGVAVRLDLTVVTVVAAVATVVAAVTVVAASATGGPVPRFGRRHRLSPGELAGALEQLASAMRAGASPRHALEEVAAVATGAVGADLRVLRRRVDLGLPLPDVIGSWPALRPEVPEVARVSVALALALETGGSAARAVDEVADAVRARGELEAEVAALASQARASAVVMGVLPVAFVAVAATVDPAVAVGLVGTSFGRACLLGGLALETAGWAWMRRIVRVVPA